MPNYENKGKFVFKVNGVELSTDFEKLVTTDILNIARENEAIPGKPENYELKGEKGTYGPDDWINLSEDNVFITVPMGPTPVA